MLLFALKFTPSISTFPERSNLGASSVIDFKLLIYLEAHSL